jgi:hypothetical protein
VRWTRYFLLFHHEALDLVQAWHSADRRASAEMNGDKIAELNHGWSLVFTKARWLTGAASMFPDDRGKSCGPNMFMSQGKRPVIRQPLTAVATVATCLCFRIVGQFGRVWRITLGLNGAIFQFLGNRLFSGAPWKLYPRVPFCGWCETESKLWKTWTLCSCPFACCS